MEPAPQAVADLLEPGSEITLENCHREPIATPGGIQAHGALLAIADADGRIIQRSENALMRLGATEELLGSRLEDLLGADDAAWLRAPAAGDLAGLRPRTVRIVDGRFDAFSYRAADGVTVVELEPTGPESTAMALADDVAALLAALGAAENSLGLLEIAARWARQLTGFDRVWIYRFEPDDHGVVIVEDRGDDLPPFLGLHFPARDIPPQARALFLQNRVRFIPDSFGTASPLTPLVNPVSGGWLDLSAGILRAVSPMHLQYLQNLGATASASIAIEVDGRLWGLISGHHYHGPRVVEHRVRLACEVLGRVVSSRLGGLLAEERSARRRVTDGFREEILGALVTDDGEPLGVRLGRAGDVLLGLCEADGVAALIGDRLERIGQTPSPETIRALAAGLEPGPGTEIVLTDSLATDRPELADLAAPTCGVISLALDPAGEGRLLWFRNEYVHSLTWGDSGLAPARGRLSPSGSYQTWTESVTGAARPWSDADREAVLNLRAGIGSVVLAQAERLARANQELERSNADLGAFTFVVAHDLREPLRNIQSFVDFFLEDHGDALPSDGLDQLATVQRLARRMDGLMDSLLEHARADHRELVLEPTTLGTVVEEITPLLAPHSSRGTVAVLTPDAGIRVDRDAMTHILLNLIANAMKYSPGEHPRVEIDVRPAAPGRGVPGMGAVAVRDFGIGIPDEHRTHIFELFRRLHPRDAYGGGSGAGLAIARRLAQRQGGDLWLETSAPDEGSLFCVAVPLTAGEDRDAER